MYLLEFASVAGKFTTGICDDNPNTHPVIRDSINRSSTDNNTTIKEIHTYCWI